MSSANYITARDLFLAHHWKRYVPFDRDRFEGFVCGRIASKEGNVFVLTTAQLATAGCERASVQVLSWSVLSLREPKAAESAPSAHEVLAIGDWVGVSPAGDVVLFAPCARHGVAALQEGEVLIERARAWEMYLASVRAFFKGRGFVEMTTPTLAPSPGTEPFLDPLSLTIEADGVLVEKFLITSPEFHLKKALAAGVPRLFEIAKCFRDREGGGHHRVEFHMLEWYRSFASLREIADDVEALIQVFVPAQKLKRATMADLFHESIGFRLECSTSRDELREAAEKAGVRTTHDDDFDDIFHRIFLEKIEPNLGVYSAGGPLLLSGYPPSMAALARVGEDGFADRFEVYWQGLELCNAFHELNDPAENRRRFEKDNQMKERSGREQVPLDEELLRSFDLGVPPAGGIALGLERLFMALHKMNDIDGVRPFQTS